MEQKSDTALQQEVQSLIERANLPLAVDVVDARARITGAVTSQNEYQAAMDLVRSVDGVEGVEDEIEIATTGPDSAFDDTSQAQGFDFVETPSYDASAETEIEPDMTDDFDASADSFQESVEEAEPYFPPTDPVVEPSEDEQELDMLGGTQDTSMDELADEPELDSTGPEPESPLAGQRDDETIREDILRELREDAVTTELELDVEVVRGVAILRGQVTDLQDALNAEEVARRVPGVLDVQEETTVEQQ